MVSHVTSAEFARSFGCRAPQLAWLLGAGASASAGVPTGSDMITDFKTRIYCADTSTPRQEVDVSDPLWNERITAYFDGARGFPPAGDAGEYAKAFEATYPEASDRRSYIEAAVKRGTASFAHHVLASLVTGGLTRCMFTTNFDPLIERTVTITDDLLPPERQAHLVVSSLDSVERGERCVSESSWPLLLKLHGDYQSEHLKNTAQELQTQDERLRKLLVDVLGSFGLVVVGYSGRDDSVMDALDDAISADGAMPSGLWWVSQPGVTLNSRVLNLLREAEERGIEAHVVDSENFDEFAGDIEREVDLDDVLQKHVSSLRPVPTVVPVALPTTFVARFPVLRCSALQVLQLPTEAREVLLDKPVTTVEARKLVRAADVWATVASRGRTLAAFGADEDIERAFAPVGGRLGGRVDLNCADDSLDLGLIYDAFTKAVARHRPLRPILRQRGHTVLVRPPDESRDDAIACEHRDSLEELRRAYDSDLTGTVPDIKCPFHEAIRVRLELWEGRWWFVYEPYTWVDLPRNRVEGHTDDASDESLGDRGLTFAGRSSKDIAGDWRRERWARRYNAQWNDIVAAWAKLIAPESETDLAAHYSRGEGLNAVFRVSWTTAWSSPGSFQAGSTR